MKLIKKFFAVLSVLFAAGTALFATPFNSNLSKADLETINSGEILIKKINFTRNMCLNEGINPFGDKLIKVYHKLYPKYLAEIIQKRPVEGNEDLPERLNEILVNISDYAGIPYFSERTQSWWDLYTSASIVEEKDTENGKEILADIEMEPFGTIKQQISIESEGNTLLYDSINLNKLSYYDKFDCVWPKKMKMSIFLFQDGENWVLYGIGGVNAPRIPFFTERIDTSFINRIKTFCNYIFEQI